MMSNTNAHAKLAAVRLWLPLSSRNFSALWVGETVSVLGTQFHLVALPWVILQKGSGFTLGTIMMAAGIPRALLMLAGGALADRFSARATMLFSNLARSIIVGGLAALIWSNAVRTEMILILVILFGAADAFFYPAYMSIVPRLVPTDHIGRANSLLQSSAQLMVLIGPTLAGILISTSGVARAFAIDSLSFLFAFLALSLVTIQSSSNKIIQPNVLSSLAEGLRYAWKDGFIRGAVFLTAIVNLACIGPLSVGTALLARQKFESATSLGVMLSASGAGALLGALTAGVWQPLKRRGALMLIFPLFLGLILAGMMAAPNLVSASIVRGCAGAAAGFMHVFSTTLLQKRVAPAMLGRVMGVITLAMFGFQPFSYLFAGILAQFGVSEVFLSGGVLLLLGALLTSFIPEMRRFQ